MSKALSQAARRPLVLQPREIAFYAVSVIFASGNLLLPMALHSVPDAGRIFLPIYFFTAVAAWEFGWASGLLVAVLSPVLNFVLTGMPPEALLPGILVRSVLVVVVASWAAFRMRPVFGLLLAAAVMQVLGSAFDLLIGTPVFVVSRGLLLGIPGVAIMVLGGFAAIYLLERTGLVKKVGNRGHADSQGERGDGGEANGSGEGNGGGEVNK